MSFKTTRNMAVGIRQRMAGIYGGIGQTYIDKVIGYGPIAYWVMNETAGVTAVDQINSPAQDGTYTGVTLANGTAPDGSVCPFFDGANDINNILTATLQTAFDHDEGTWAIWARVANAGVWSDSSFRTIFNIEDDNANRLYLAKAAANNTLEWLYRSNNIPKLRTQGGYTTTDWFHIGATWSQAADEFRPYYSGIQVGATFNALGAWTGDDNYTTMAIGAYSALINFVWHGWLAHAVIFDTPLTGAQVLDLATV